MELKVSVIITAYNEEKHIYKCLSTLELQTYKNMEIIVVDNGSTDCTNVISQVFKKVRTLFLERNLGPGGGRNYGARKARGDILVFVDADMFFERNYIEKLVQPILEGKEVGTFHGQELVGNKENVWARSWCINRIPFYNEYSGVFRSIKKDVFNTTKGFDNSKGYFDDALETEYKSYCVEDAVCYHNNPTTLKEVYEHSKWVGRSLYKDKKTLNVYLGSFKKFIFPLFILFVSLCAFYINWRKYIIYPLLFLLISSLFIIYKPIIQRVVKEKYPLYVITIPILTIVKFTGYFFGFIKELINQ